MAIVTDAIKSHGSKGGGSRYREEHKIIDMTTDESLFCNCWRHQEERRAWKRLFQ